MDALLLEETLDYLNQQMRCELQPVGVDEHGHTNRWLARLAYRGESITTEIEHYRPYKKAVFTYLLQHAAWVVTGLFFHECENGELLRARSERSLASLRHLLGPLADELAQSYQWHRDEICW